MQDAEKGEPPPTTARVTAGFIRSLSALCRVIPRIDLLENATPYANSAKEPFPTIVFDKA